MKPKVTCHIMSSVDGRLLPGRWTAPYKGTDAGLLFKEYADLGRLLETDAWMFGKNTAKEAFPYKFMAKTERKAKAGKFHTGKRDSSRLFITIDPDADIYFTSEIFRGDNIVVIVDTTATEEYLEMLEEKGISYVVLEDATDLGAVMEALGDKFGIKSISLQGGGIINGAMLSAGLIDELSIVVYPGIDGFAGSPSIFESLTEPGKQKASEQTLEFMSAHTCEHGVVWLRYRVHHK